MWCYNTPPPKSILPFHKLENENESLSVEYSHMQHSKTHTHTRAHTHMPTHTHAYTHTHTHTHTRAHTHVTTHTHVVIQGESPLSASHNYGTD